MLLTLLSRFWPYLLALGLLGYAAAYIRGAERAKDRLEQAEKRVLVAEQSAAANQTEFESCLTLNRINTALAAQEREKAAKAVAEARELRKAGDERERRIDDEAETMRARGGECPAIDGDFRQWMRDRTP